MGIHLLLATHKGEIPGRLTVLKRASDTPFLHPIMHPIGGMWIPTGGSRRVHAMEAEAMKVHLHVERSLLDNNRTYVILAAAASVYWCIISERLESLNELVDGFSSTPLLQRPNASPVQTLAIFEERFLLARAPLIEKILYDFEQSAMQSGLHGAFCSIYLL